MLAVRRAHPILELVVTQLDRFTIDDGLAARSSNASGNQVGWRTPDAFL
jgi:hypothetical protein